MDSLSNKSSGDKQNNTKENAINQSTPASSDKKTNVLAIVALILAFIFPLVGLILGIVALAQIKKNKEAGKGLAVASIIVSSFFTLIAIGLIIFWAIFIGSFSSALNSNGVNINTQSGSLDIKNKEGDSLSIGGDAKIPEGFPADVPIYPSSKVDASSAIGGSYNLVISTKDSKNKVDSYYKTELENSGWTAGNDSITIDSGGTTQKTFSKGNQTLSVITTEDTNTKGTTVTLSVVNNNQ